MMKEIEIEVGQHLTVKTPHGMITLFIGNNHRSITSYVDDVELLGFYTTKTTKKTHETRFMKGRAKMVQLKPVGE